MARHAEVKDALQRAEKLIKASSWPPDMFVALVDVLAVDSIWQSAQADFIDANRDPLRVSDEEARARVELRGSAARNWEVSASFRERALAAIRGAGAWNEGHLGTEAPDARDFPREFAVLSRAIDAEAFPLSLDQGSLVPDRFQAARDLLRTRGTFTKEASGRLIPSAARSVRGNSLRQFYGNLLRVGPAADQGVDYGVSSSIPTKPPGAALIVGFIPTVHAAGEMSWSIERGAFHVRLNPKFEKKVIERVIRSLEWLLSRRADVIVIPELVSSIALRERVGEELRSHAAHTPLLVVCGSEAVRSDSPTKRTNRAFVLGPSGRELWTQDKHHPYSISAEQIAQWGLQRQLGKVKRNEVGTSTRKKVVIRDIPGSGRFCVVVCEDLARSEPVQNAIRDFGVDMGVVVVMNGLFSESGWRLRHAVNLAEEPGSRIAIGNSCAILARMEPRPTSPDLRSLAYYVLPNHGLTSVTLPPRASASDPPAVLVTPILKV